MIPDMDEPHSHIGKRFSLFSIPINKLVGHRTLTHSLVFTTVLGLILWPLIPHGLVYAIVAGILAHILGDMVTGKVNVLYPLSVSIGVPVSRVGYLVIDRMTRIELGVIILVFIGKHELAYFQNVF